MLKRNSLLIAAAVVGTVLATASTDARVITRYNDLTFNAAVALPGMTLRPGTYRFEIINTWGTQDIVRVSDPKTSRTYVTAFTMRVPRPRGLPKHHLVTFGEAPEGTPARINVWFPMDASDGRQFIY